AGLRPVYPTAPRGSHGSDPALGTHGRLRQSSKRLRRSETPPMAEKRKARAPGWCPGTEPLSEDQPVAKSINRKVVSAPARVKPAVCLSPEAFKRLGAACISEGMTQSDLVELMINRLLSGYVISVRGERISATSATPVDRLNPAPEINR